MRRPMVAQSEGGIRGLGLRARTAHSTLPQERAPDEFAHI
jgi:hypothetical protein